MKGLLYVAAIVAAITSTSTGTQTESDRHPFGPVAESIDATGTAVGDFEQAAVDPVDEARIVLEAPTSARVGELVRFDLTQSNADSVKWIVRPGTVDFEVYDSGRRAVFSARAPGEYLFIIAVASGGTVDVITHTVTVKGPPKEPTEPDLAQWVPYWLYPLQLPVDEALSLAQSFEETAARITSLSTPKGIIEATAEANRAALGPSIGNWKPLLKKLQAAMRNRAQAGTLTTPDQHKEMWLEIARGLRRYAE